jgi:hypothetical protein
LAAVSLYRIPPSQTPYQRPSALAMQQRAASMRFLTLLLAAQGYLAEGRDLAHSMPQTGQRPGLVPRDWFGGEPFPAESGNTVFHTASILGPLPHGAVAVGIEGTYAALKPIIELYRPWASAIYFPYSAPLAPSGSDGSRIGDRSRIGMMLMAFDRDGLVRAAQVAGALSVLD